MPLCRLRPCGGSFPPLLREVPHDSGTDGAPVGGVDRQGSPFSLDRPVSAPASCAAGTGTAQPGERGQRPGGRDRRAEPRCPLSARPGRRSPRRHRGGRGARPALPRRRHPSTVTVPARSPLGRLLLAVVLLPCLALALASGVVLHGTVLLTVVVATGLAACLGYTVRDDGAGRVHRHGLEGRRRSPGPHH